MNNTLVHYGALSPYGEEIPLACMGIVMKINHILLSFIIGISIGAQPIIGYNYGAKDYKRVKEAYKTSVIMASAFAIVGFLIFEIFPYQIIALFGEENALFTEFAVKGFRIYLMFIFTAGFQILSASYFQAIGKPLKASVLSLSRQVLLLVPLLILLPRIFGLDGALYAGPTADGLSALITGYFIIKEIKGLDIVTAK
jgi:Na+-driven multidrug efflux pump